MSQSLGTLGGMAFVELTFFDFPSTPTHSAHPHKIQTQIKVWRQKDAKYCKHMSPMDMRNCHSLLTQCPGDKIIQFSESGTFFSGSL